MALWLGVLVGVIFTILGWSPPQVKASNQFVASLAGSGALVEVSLSTNSPIHLKACFSTTWRDDTDTNPSGLDCAGETWNGNEWLNQNNSWNRFTAYPVENGRIRTLVGVKSNDEALQPFLYIMALIEGESASHRFRLPIHFDVIPEAGDRTIIVQLDARASSPVGWLVIHSQTGKDWRLWTNDRVSVLTRSHELHLGYQSAIDTIVEYPRLYQFSQPGTYQLWLGPPPSHKYEPTISGKTNIFVSAPNSFSLETTKAYQGQIEWYIDGQRLLAWHGSKITNLKLSPGIHTLSVRLIDSNEWSQTSLQVTPSAWVRFGAVLPVAQTGGREKITIINNGLDEIDLKGWIIESQASGRKLNLTGQISPGEQITIEPRGYLANDGGVYSLVDPFNGVIDRLTYSALTARVTLVRSVDSIVWVNQVQSLPVEYVTIEGTITSRRGKILDLAPTSTAPIHLLVATDNFPPVRKGQNIRLLGVERKAELGKIEYRIIATTLVYLTPVAKQVPVFDLPVAPSHLIPNLPDGTTVRESAGTSIRPPPPRQLSASQKRSQLVFIALLFGLGLVFLLPHPHSTKIGK